MKENSLITHSVKSGIMESKTVIFLKDEADYNSAVRSEISIFENEIQNLKLLLPALSVGTEEEFDFISSNTGSLTDTFKEISSVILPLEVNVHDLKIKCHESFAMIGQANSKNRWVEPGYMLHLRHRALDPMCAKRMKNIEEHYQFISSHLDELQEKVHKEWMESLKLPKELQKSISGLHLRNEKLNSESHFDCSGEDNLNSLSKIKPGTGKKGHLKVHEESYNFNFNKVHNDSSTIELNEDSLKIDCVQKLRSSIENKLENNFMSIIPPDKISVVRNHQVKYKKLLNTLSPLEIIKDYRQEVNEIAEACIAKLEKHLDTVLRNADTAGKKEKVALEKHINIITQQQKIFQHYLSNVKSQYADMHSLDIMSVIDKCEEIFEDVNKECILLNRFLPIYALKEEITSMIEQTKVTIILADALYSVSAVLPIFCKSYSRNGTIVVCEPDSVIADSTYHTYLAFTNNTTLTSSCYKTSKINNQKNEVLCTTSEKLLLHSLSDPEFASYSLVILNCALKRTVEDDLLLAALKQSMKPQNDFKFVLILSPYEHAARFSEYFSPVASVSFLVTPKLIFPVRTIWMKGSPTENYIHKVVETALSIHALSEAGDVLVYLPSVEDILKTSSVLSLKLQEYNYYDADCVCIDGSLTESLLSTANKSSNIKRKFILATSPVEFLLFPTVSYVIDTGLTRECNYDSQKCIEVQKLTFISRKRAKLRKDCAGRFRSGTCFRLYNKNNYFSYMAGYELSHVLEKNPVETVIKTFQYRPKGVDEIEFVEPMPRGLKDSAIAMLETSDAVKDGQLTLLGEEVAKLPFLPNYSKLIIMGIQWGFSFEAVLLVAFFLMKRSIFIYDNDTKVNKSLATKKLQFLLNDSDTLTYLNVYRLWMENNFQEEWCKANYLDFVSLSKVKDKVTEIIYIVQHRLKENIISEIREEKVTDWHALQEIVFYCFMDNLCVYSGHSRSGYHLHRSRAVAFVDPLSPVLYKGDLPQFVVFNNLVSSTRNFMAVITAVPEELVFSAVEKGILPMEMLDLLHFKLQPYVIESVGITVVKEIFQGAVGKWHNIEDEVKTELKSDMIVLEPSEERGSITLFTLPEDMKKAEIIVRNILEKKRKHIISEEETRCLELKKGKYKVTVNITWTKGALITGFMLDSNNVIGNSQSQTVNTVADGNVTSIRQAINLTWPRRLCTGYGIVSFNSSDFKIARRLSMKMVKVQGQEAVIKINDDVENQLLVSGLSLVTVCDDLEKAMKNILPNYISIQKISLAYERPFETTEEDLEVCSDELVLLCCCLNSFVPISPFEVNITKPKDTSKVMRATVKSDNSPDIGKAVQVINNKFTFMGLPIKAEAEYSSNVTCTIDIFNAVQQRLMNELQLLEKQMAEPSEISCSELYQFKADTEDYHTAELRFSTKSQNVMNILQRTVQKILEGEVINCDMIKDLHKLFTHGGHLWLRTLEKKENVHIIDEYKSKTIRIYGSPSACERAYKRISEFMVNVENEVVAVVDLSQGKSIRALFKLLIQKYGTGLESFIEEFHLRSAEINIRTSELFLHGCSASIEKAQAALENLANSSLACAGKEGLISSEGSCSACRMSLQLSVRLEHCSHLYCLECVKSLITCFQFPIQCCAEGCDKELVLEDIHKVLGYDEELINNLLHHSLKYYISKNSHIVYCPAPDCSMFYDTSELFQERWNCPLCQNDICIKCNVIFHHGYTCEVYQGSKMDVNYPYKVWVRDSKSNSKQCPMCKTGIEKTGGCNHMTCCTCHCHFCWLCATAFPTEQLVYDHMPFCPQNQGR